MKTPLLVAVEALLKHYPDPYYQWPCHECGRVSEAEPKRLIHKEVITGSPGDNNVVMTQWTGCEFCNVRPHLIRLKQALKWALEK